MCYFFSPPPLQRHGLCLDLSNRKTTQGVHSRRGEEQDILSKVECILDEPSWKQCLSANISSAHVPGSHAHCRMLEAVAAISACSWADRALAGLPTFSGKCLPLVPAETSRPASWVFAPQNLLPTCSLRYSAGLRVCNSPRHSKLLQ